MFFFFFQGFFAPASSQIRKLLFVEAEKSWSEAQSYCRERYTDLVTVDSQDEAELLFTAEHSLNDAAWIGLYRDTQNWQWSNSDDVIYTNWRADLFCASVNSQGEWDDLVCSEKKAFMCFKETSNITARYTLIEEPRNWTEAQQYCREHHTDLVNIKSASENEDLIREHFSKKFPMDGVNMRWRKQDGEIFHKDVEEEDEEEEEEEKCSDPFHFPLESSEPVFYDRRQTESLINVLVSKHFVSSVHPLPSQPLTGPIYLFSGICEVAASHFRKYHFVKDEKSWFDAQSYCRENHTDLATIESQEETEKVLNISAGLINAWIGLYYDKENWQWSNGDNVSYYNWKSSLSCISVDSNGEWVDSDCHSNRYSFICYNGKVTFSFSFLFMLF
ncbi:hypothetical protein HHUSO_G36581 [Huso huso]|uniref:C-type lectin domain-containing protein n=1 Tax=Huso huso TaxID=61971 RepID=A0ABR0Y1I6_HUSHU